MTAVVPEMFYYTASSLNCVKHKNYQSEVSDAAVIYSVQYKCPAKHLCQQTINKSKLHHSSLHNFGRPTETITSFRLSIKKK